MKYYHPGEKPQPPSHRMPKEYREKCATTDASMRRREQAQAKRDMRAAKRKSAQS